MTFINLSTRQFLIGLLVTCARTIIEKKESWQKTIDKSDWGRFSGRNGGHIAQEKVGFYDFNLHYALGLRYACPP